MFPSPGLKGSRTRTWGWGWLGILSPIPPLPEIVYASHARGFALASARNPALGRYYIQVPLETKTGDWSDDRFWTELTARCPPELAAHKKSNSIASNPPATRKSHWPDSTQDCHPKPPPEEKGYAWLRVDKAGSPGHDRRMPRSAFVSAVRAVDWRHLRSTYESGEIVRDIILSLASRDEAEVTWAWQRIGETVLRHQGTVYPATAAAAPFLCQIALDGASLRRAALTAELAFLSTGHDEPHAPAGTAQAVRDAVRPYAGELLGLWGSTGPGLDMALVAVSVAFPAEAAVITAQLRDWFSRSEPPLRTALGLALGFHGLADEAAERIILDQVGQSICWVIRTAGPVAFLPDDSPFPRPAEEPRIDSPVPDAIRVAERLRAGAEEQTSAFAPVSGFLRELMESGGHLIDWPR